MKKPQAIAVWSDARTKREKRALYLSLIPVIREVARRSGYAVGVHGSLTRDCDLIAAPWTRKSVSAYTLATRICNAVCRYPSLKAHDYYYRHLRAVASMGNSREKPHGRQAFSIFVGPDCYIDLSVMPRQ